MNDNLRKIWVDKLSLSSLTGIFKILCRYKHATICYIERSYAAFMIILFVKLVKIFNIHLQQLTYSLGDMYYEGSETSLGMEVYYILPEVAYEILQKIKENSMYDKLSHILPREKVDIYFEKKISEELYPTIRLLLIARWHKENKKDSGKDIILCPDTDVILVLKQIRRYKTLSLETYKSIDFLLDFLKVKLKSSRAIFCPRRLRDYFNSSIKNNIAIHYSERGSSIFWHPNSDVTLARMVVYVDYPILNSRKVLSQLEEDGIKWVALSKGIVDYPDNMLSKKSFNSRLKGHAPYRDIINKDVLKNCHSDWYLRNTATELLSGVNFWTQFYKNFGIRILFDIGAQFSEGISQNIASDFVDVICVGAQKSQVTMQRHQPFLRYNSKHIYFIWGSETLRYMDISKATRYFIISGHPLVDESKKYTSQRKNERDSQKKKGIKFIITLFDNAYDSDSPFSKKMMKYFYSHFFQWLMDDEELLIIAKEKRGNNLDKIALEMNDSMDRVVKTGRFIRFDNPLNYLPSRVSYNSDMVIGIGISSAVIEAVIAGCRGIHCDLSENRVHNFYRWGYEKIVFDDIDRMIAALKRYKENPAHEPGLGDWSSHIDKLDPFHDGKAGERVGAYIRWLLERFDKGEGRDDAIRYANERYAERWGIDKVIDVNSQIRGEYAESF